MTEREAIAHVLGTGLYGFGGRVSASARLKIADTIVQALGAAGFLIVRKVETKRAPFVIEDDDNGEVTRQEDGK